MNNTATLSARRIALAVLLEAPRCRAWRSRYAVAH